MRKPLFMAVFFSFALGIVIFAKYKLDQAIEEGKFEDIPGDKPFDNSVDIGIENDRGAAADSSPSPHQAAGDASQGASKTDVMAALVQAREKFRLKTDVTEQAKENVHNTPNAIILAAETLGNLRTLEQQNPAYKPEFLAFYLECSKDSEMITVTRVQCLDNYVKSSGITGADEENIVSSVDAQVQSLYRELKK